MRGGLQLVIEELLIKRLKLDVTHHAYPWARAQAMVQYGEADAFFGASTPERLRFAVITDEWLAQARLSAFVSADQAALPQYRALQSSDGFNPLQARLHPGQ